MEKYPLYTRAEAQTASAESGSESQASPASTAGAVQIPIEEEMKPVTYEILGKDELSKEEQKELDEIKNDPVKRTEFYAQRINQRYYRDMYEKRQKILTGTGSIDFDHFVDELKNTDNTKFEDLPGTIFAEDLIY